MYKFTPREKAGQFDVLCHRNAYEVREVDVDRDIETLHTWMNHRHVAKFWKLDKPVEELRKHFIKHEADSHQKLYMLAKDGVDFAYFEKYSLAGDPFGEYLDYSDKDFGYHILIGNPRMVGRGVLHDTLSIITLTLFETEDCERVFGEPDVRVKPFIMICNSLGYKWRAMLGMPDKRANIFEINRKAFYKKNEVLAC